MAHYRRPPPGRLRPGVLDNKTQIKQTRKTFPPQGACKSPKKGPERKNNKGKSDTTNKSQEKHNPRSQCHSLPRRAVGHWRSQCLLMSTRIPTKGLHNCDRNRPRPIPNYGACSRARRTGRAPAAGACPTRGTGVPPRCHVCILKTKPHKDTLKQKTQG